MHDDIGSHRRMVQALSRRIGARCIETHISWVLLAGDDAFKFKKPVRLPFVDYSTFERRRLCCEEEVRLNARLAPEVYIGVVPVTGSADDPLLGGAGPAIAHAVHMKRFPDGCLFSEMLEAHTLETQHLDALAGRLAAFHGHAPRANASQGFGTPRRRHEVALAALEGACAAASAQEEQRAREWIGTQAASLAPLWQHRLDAGCVRECHGDLHLDNVIALDDGVAAFDCIEFDPALRWIDVVDDIAFTVMDFSARTRSDFAFRLLNAWLDASGDHAGIPALRFALAYRALVRSQVKQLRTQPRSREARRYFEDALRWMTPTPLRLAITHGLPGSGKTYRSQAFLEREGAIRLRSDVERKRLFGLAALEDSRAKGVDIYGADATRRTYELLFGTAASLLRDGWPVVLDAAFLKRAERDNARAVATACGARFAILDCDAPPAVLRERLRARKGDASEADEAVLSLLEASAEPLAADERAFVAGR